MADPPDQSGSPCAAPPRGKPGPKARPAVRGEDLFGGKYVRTLQGHLDRLRAAHPHPNRTLFFDDVAVAYLLAFFSPSLRSLRTLEDASQTPRMRENTTVGRIPRSTPYAASTPATIHSVTPGPAHAPITNPTTAPTAIFVHTDLRHLPGRAGTFPGALPSSDLVLRLRGRSPHVST